MLATIWWLAFFYVFCYILLIYKNKKLGLHRISDAVCHISIPDIYLVIGIEKIVWAGRLLRDSITELTSCLALYIELSDTNQRAL